MLYGDSFLLSNICNFSFTFNKSVIIVLPSSQNMQPNVGINSEQRRITGRNQFQKESFHEKKQNIFKKN